MASSRPLPRMALVSLGKAIKTTFKAMAEITTSMIHDGQVLFLKFESFEKRGSGVHGAKSPTTGKMSVELTTVIKRARRSTHDEEHG
ncbi:hypothetical protein BGZ83_003786, partial [Gryganskiella cystojenkinii]